MAKVYVMVDEQNRIIDINSDVFLTDTSGWIEIDDGEGDRYAHAQGNYLDGPIRDEYGVARYSWTGEAVEERGSQELEADRPEGETVSTTDQRLDEMEAALYEVKVHTGLSTLDDVPARLQPEVNAMLQKDVARQ